MKVNELLSACNLLKISPTTQVSFCDSEGNEILFTKNYRMLEPLFCNYEVQAWSVSFYTSNYVVSYTNGIAGKLGVIISIKDWNPEELVASGKTYEDVKAEDYQPGVNYENEKTYNETLEKLFPSQDPSDHDNDDIRNLKLTRRAFNCLHRAGIQSIGDLREFTANELLVIRNFGKHCLQEVQDELNAYGLHLKED